MTTGHWKVVYPPGTEQGVKRTSRMSSVWLVLGDQEIKLPGITGFTFSSGVDDADRITLGAVGTVEVVYADDTAGVEVPFDETDFLVADLKAAREEP